jgi:hypothetical protein
MWLLLWPQHLSADWSFNCLPLVEQLQDPRNLATGALYAYLLYCFISAQPWAAALQLLKDLRGPAAPTKGRQAPPAAKAATSSTKPPQGSPGLTTAAPAAPSPAESSVDAMSHDAALMCARWRLTVAAGLLVAPFFPASNVLFYVGTFIGERLLYFPSVGYCLLLADLLGQAWLGLQAGGPNRVQEPQQSQPQQGSAAQEPQQQEQGASAPQSGGASAAGGSGKSRAAGAVPVLARALLVLLVLCGLLVGAARTWLRNEDWTTEDALFLAAEKVRPGPLFAACSGCTLTHATCCSMQHASCA